MSPRAVDVLVVGAGPRGLAAALGLARAGASVEVLDPQSRPRLPWTEVHHWSVLPGLESLGVLEDLLAVGTPAAGWGLRVLATGEQLTYDLGELRDEVRHPFNLRVPEPALRRVLARHLLALPGTAVRPGRLRTLTQHPDRVDVEHEHGALTARWVLAADGPSSPTRREAGIAFEGSSAGERSVTALVEHDFAAHGYCDTTFQVDGRCGAVVEHVGATTWRYSFQEPVVLPEEDLARRIEVVLREVTGRCPRVVAWTTERVHQRAAASFRAGRVLVVGDAAHVTHRLIGHSSIAGWFDVLSLVGALGAALHGGGAEPDPLEPWARGRRKVYLDEAVPASLSRKHLLTQIADPARLGLELEEFRQALGDRAVRRAVLLRGRELDGGFRAPGPPRLPG